MLKNIYSLLGYGYEESINNNVCIDKLDEIQNNIEEFQKKRAVKIIEYSYINYLKRKAIKKKRKERRVLYRRIKRTNPTFLKNLDYINKNKFV